MFKAFKKAAIKKAVKSEISTLQSQQNEAIKELQKLQKELASV